jgi:hypothetical protein
MIPPRAKRGPNAPILPVAGNWYGTTLRVYDPGLDAWHILWSDPATQFYTRQIGRARGQDIVQEGKLDSGDILRWSFTEITPNSFHWLGEHSADGGATWPGRYPRPQRGALAAQPFATSVSPRKSSAGGVGTRACRSSCV